MAGLGRSWAYALSALLGLMLGYAYHAVLGTRFSYKPSLGLYGLPLLRLVLIRNSSFAVILFLLGISPSAQYIALFMSMLVSGIMIAPANPCIAILGTLPHGVLELMGFTLIAMSGNEYMQGNKANSTKLVLGASLLIIAAVIESYATPIILAKSINMC